MSFNENTISSTDQITEEKDTIEMHQRIDADNNLMKVNLNGTKVMVASSSFASPLIDIDRFVSKVINTDKPAFRITKNENGAVSSEALALSKYYDIILRYQACHSEKYWYSEYVELFFRCCKKLGIWGYPFGKPNNTTLGLSKADGEIFNSLLDMIRSESRTASFQHRLSQRIKNCDNNYQSAQIYINKLSEKYSKLMVVRVDPGYKAELAYTITLEQAQTDMKRFLSNWRTNKLFEHCVGYIWKLEMGDMKGFHYHLVLFFNGNKINRDAYYAEEICNYWIDLVTRGRGHCTNSNQRKYTFDECAVGIIDHTDVDKREALLKNIRYITKKEQYIKLKTSIKTRVFSRGEMPDLPKTQLGRPRKSNSADTEITPEAISGHLEGITEVKTLQADPCIATVN